jgi:hypothetical protein
VEIQLTPKVQSKGYEPVLNHIPLNDKPQPPVLPEVQPARPSVPRLHIEKIVTADKNSQANPAQFNIKENGKIEKKIENFNRIETPTGNINEKASKSSESSESSEESEKSKEKDDPKKDNQNERESVTSSSGFSKSSKSSSIDESDSIFKKGSIKNSSPSGSKKNEPVVYIVQKKNNPDDSSISQNLESDSNRPKINQQSQSNNLMFSVKYLTFTQLFLYLQKFNQIDEQLWDSQNLCQSLCRCFSKDNIVTPSELQDLLKLQKLCHQTYDNSDEFHRYLLFSYYCKVTSKNELNFDLESAKLIGLSSIDHKSNELSQTFTLASILHLVFLFERNIQVLQVFQSARRHKAFTFLNLSKILMNQSLNLLKRKRINQIFDHQTNAVQAFFEYHSGFISIWAELANTADFSASVREASTRALNNPMLCRQICNKP